MSKLVAFLKDETGATAIEYGLIAAGISVVIIASVNAIGSRLNSTFQLISELAELNFASTGMRKPPETAASGIFGEAICVISLAARIGAAIILRDAVNRWRANAAQVLFVIGCGKERHRRHRHDARIGLLQHPLGPRHRRQRGRLSKRLQFPAWYPRI